MRRRDGDSGTALLGLILLPLFLETCGLGGYVLALAGLARRDARGAGPREVD